jgi:HSP20 family protein
LSGLFDALNTHPLGQHPWAQVLRSYAEQAGVAQRSADTLVPDNGENSFVPPVDVFSTETAYFVHIALPGAKKEDVGVNFDSDKGILNIAGIVYRQGDEEFLKTLTQSERKVGVFDRNITLPPANEEKEEVDGDAITAKLEDGILVVSVPKVEKEWTEVKKVDIN